MQIADADRRWTSVLNRDRAADGAFVYAVSSTGIYCRPSCASRRPARERVVFFDAIGDAERAGYRACKRCRPDASEHLDPWVNKIRRACVYLSNVDGQPSLAKLAENLGGSPYHLQRNFKRLVGVTPREYADACRLRKVKRALRNGLAVTGAVVDAGYGSSSRFYERAAGKLGMPPALYRRGSAGVEIRYATAGAPLGRVLVAATGRGVCAITLGGSDRALEVALEREYPAATITRDRDGSLGQWIERVLQHLAGKTPRLDLPLDIQATAFQWQVWQALASIPYGETRTYRELANAIGRPRAVRAVASACAKNPVALAIPCHRAVSADRRTVGYRWGASRKTALLASERRRKPGSG
jgi:AraC family transcriptional regulator, regulatory protein of adaptative response / methylated-DNA-[protein]-cysteine methyltransferase